jgi:hypothetical protein
MIPSSVLLMTASSADSIKAASQYCASSGLFRFVNWFSVDLSFEDLASERLLDIFLLNSHVHFEGEGVAGV